MHTWHAWDELQSGQSSLPFSLHDVSVFLALQSPPCVYAVVCLRQLQRVSETMWRRCDANICCIPLINASPCHSMPLKCTRPLPQSVQHIAAYGDFTVHSQPTANISQFRSENMPSVTKKKADHCCAATYFYLFLIFFFLQKLEKHLIIVILKKKKISHIHDLMSPISLFFSS